MRRLGWFVGWILLGMSTTPATWALDKSVDRQGIDARSLQKAPYNLTGKDVFIGQVELSRPSRFAVDKISNKLLQLDRIIVQPYEVFFRDGKAIPNRNVDDHSAQVAAVIISHDKMDNPKPASRLSTLPVNTTVLFALLISALGNSSVKTLALMQNSMAMLY